MTLTLDDPRVAQLLTDMVDRRVRAALDAQARIRYGTVAAIDTASKTASLLLGGSTAPSPGFVYEAASPPAVGDRVRAVNRGADRYIEANLSGWMPWDYPACVRQERDTDFAVATGSVTTVPMNNLVRQDDERDDIAINTPGPGQMTANRAGWYAIDAGILWEAFDTGRREMFLRVGGSTKGGSVVSAVNFSASIAIYLSASTLIFLNAGEEVHVSVRHSYASNLKVLAGPGSYLALTRVRS